MVRIIKKRQLGSFKDDRGILHWASPKLLNFDYKYLTIGSIEPGCKRGNHYHKKTIEQFMCINGKVTCVMDNERAVLEPGDLVYIPLLAIHTFVNEGKETAYFLEFKDREFDKQDPDIFFADDRNKPADGQNRSEQAV